MAESSRVRDLLAQFSREHKVPLIRLGELLGSKSDTVAGKTMFANKYLKKGADFSLKQVRAIAKLMGVTVEWLLFGDESLELVTSTVGRVPLLGAVSAATREWSDEQVEDWIEYPLQGKSRGVFALRVKGQCMEPRLLDGDIVYVRQSHEGRQLPNGTVVVARIGGEEATLKKYYARSESKIELIPENLEYPPIVVDDTETLEIVGTVIGRTTVV